MESLLLTGRNSSGLLLSGITLALLMRPSRPHHRAEVRQVRWWQPKPTTLEFLWSGVDGASGDKAVELPLVPDAEFLHSFCSLWLQGVPAQAMGPRPDADGDVVRSWALNVAGSKWYQLFSLESEWMVLGK